MRKNKIKKRYITAAISVMLAGCMVMTSGGVPGETGYGRNCTGIVSEVNAAELEEKDKTTDSDKDNKTE